MKAQFYIISCPRKIFCTLPFSFLLTLPVSQDGSPGTRGRWGSAGYWPARYFLSQCEWN